MEYELKVQFDEESENLSVRIAALREAHRKLVKLRAGTISEANSKDEASTDHKPAEFFRKCAEDSFEDLKTYMIMLAQVKFDDDARVNTDDALLSKDVYRLCCYRIWNTVQCSLARMIKTILFIGRTYVIHTVTVLV